MNLNAFERDLETVRENVPVGFIYCDVNNLKQTNDRRGHDMGDMLLKEFSLLMRQHFSVDCIYRTGGDEFVCMIINIDRKSFEDRVAKFICAAAEK